MPFSHKQCNASTISQVGTLKMQTQIQMHVHKNKISFLGNISFYYMYLCEQDFTLLETYSGAHDEVLIL